MAENKTQKTSASAEAFVGAIADPRVRADCETLLTLMQKASGAPPEMWGANMIGFGDYHYVYDSGREGDAALIGFAARKTALTLYMMGGSWDTGLLARLGKHTTGVGCLYIKKLADVDVKVLAALLKDAAKQAKAGAKRDAAKAAARRGR
jgi:hypothetical protein